MRNSNWSFPLFPMIQNLLKRSKISSGWLWSNIGLKHFWEWEFRLLLLMWSIFFIRITIIVAYKRNAKLFYQDPWPGVDFKICIGFWSLACKLFSKTKLAQFYDPNLCKKKKCFSCCPKRRREFEIEVILHKNKTTWRYYSTIKHIYKHRDCSKKMRFLW